MEIQELEAIIAYQQQQIESLEKTQNDLCNALNSVVKMVSTMDRRIYNNAHNSDVLLHRVENLPFEIADEISRDGFWFPQIMTEEETIDRIVAGASVARFGDGEFGIMYDVSRWRFQKVDAKLGERLRQVVQDTEGPALIGLNNFYGALSHRTEHDADGIRSYLTPEIRRQHLKFLKPGYRYANACISRSGTAQKVLNQKRIWNGKECIFIEGDKTRMGVGNDLFDNAASIGRILCPSESAFDRYDEILAEALKLPKDRLILIALGPTASVLAYDLAKAGYHAVDIGHVDISYEWYLRSGSSTHAAVPGKYNNEFKDGYLVEDIHDELYESQIICNLS